MKLLDYDGRKRRMIVRVLREGMDYLDRMNLWERNIVRDRFKAFSEWEMNCNITEKQLAVLVGINRRMRKWNQAMKQLKQK